MVKHTSPQSPSNFAQVKFHHTNQQCNVKRYIVFFSWIGASFFFFRIYYEMYTFCCDFVKAHVTQMSDPLQAHFTWPQQCTWQGCIHAYVTCLKNGFKINSFYSTSRAQREHSPQTGWTVFAVRKACYLATFGDWKLATRIQIRYRKQNFSPIFHQTNPSSWRVFEMRNPFAFVWTICLGGVCIAAKKCFVFHVSREWAHYQ